MLQGRTDQVIEEIADWGRQTYKASKLVFERVAGYFRKNLAVMAYDQYLKNGWPIATGIIEGACRHIVKDRCELSGMRWTVEGAEAILKLRCIHSNGDWDAYHLFRMQRRQQQVYGITPKDRNTNGSTNVYMFNGMPNFAEAV